MAPAKIRKDIYNLNAIAEKLPEVMHNKKQKLLFIFRGVDVYSTKADMQRIIDLLESEHKETIKDFKARMKNLQ